MLHYRQSEKVDGPLIVFLHAGGYDGRLWDATFDLLPGFHCIAPDLPGHGRSSGTELESFAQASDGVAALIESLNLKSVNIAGLSMGSYIGFKLMQRHPELVRSSVLSGFQPMPIQVSTTMRAMMHVSSWLYPSRFFREKMAQSLGVRDTSLSSQPDGGANTSAATVRKTGNLALAFDVEADLPNVLTRTLVLSGEKEHPEIKHSLLAFQDNMPDCTARIVPGRGHGWAMEVPELFAATLKAFVQENPLPEELTAAGTAPLTSH